MKPIEFRKLVFRTPFSPVKIVLHAGDSILVKHPENVGMAGSWVVTSTPSKGLAVFEVKMVVSVEYPNSSNGKK